MNDSPFSHQDWTPILLSKPKKITNNKVKPKTITNMQKLENSEEIIKPKKIDANLKKAIQQARLSNKLSQKELASKMCVPVQTIVNYENGKAIPNNQFISKLERTLKTKLPRAK